jgi:hypothetical protein
VIFWRPSAAQIDWARRRRALLDRRLQDRVAGPTSDRWIGALGELALDRYLAGLGLQEPADYRWANRGRESGEEADFRLWETFGIAVKTEQDRWEDPIQRGEPMRIEPIARDLEHFFCCFSGPHRAGSSICPACAGRKPLLYSCPTCRGAGLGPGLEIHQLGGISGRRFARFGFPFRSRAGDTYRKIASANLNRPDSWIAGLRAAAERAGKLPPF